MDKTHIKQILERLEAERSVHDEKFAGNTAHRHCMERFDKVIGNLRKESGEKRTRLDFSISQSALPDAIEDAIYLEHAAAALQLEQQYGAAKMLMDKAREVIFKEMNELDGFDR